MPVRPVRAHDDEIGLHGVRFFENLLIDAALAHRRGDLRRRQTRLLDDDRERVFRRLALLDLEVGRHVLGEHHRRERQHVDEADHALGRGRHHQRGCNRRLGQVRIREIDRNQDSLVHGTVPLWLAF